MKLFRPAGLWKASPDSYDWTREKGLSNQSEFPFPALYLDEDTEALAEKDPSFTAFLNACLERFVCHEYGHLSSLDQVENYINRDVKKENTWMRGNYESTLWGEVRLEIFFDKGLFHRNDTAPRALAIEQARKERERA